jgi:hypothetical protein
MWECRCNSINLFMGQFIPIVLHMAVEGIIAITITAMDPKPKPLGNKNDEKSSMR